MSTRGAAIVFCERLDNESFCESVIRELGAFYEVRPCGPGWPARDLAQVDRGGVRFYLELDAASGSFVRPEGLARLDCAKFAWLIDTHKKPSFHAQISCDMDVTFYAHKVWGHVFSRGQAAWLPLHADQEIFHPVDRERDLDLVFVGSQEWRADPLRRIAAKHGLRLHVSCTTGNREKSESAALYARTKLVFNRHCANDLNFRVFEAMACGRVLLSDAQWNGQYELFEDGRHYLLYKDEADLERLVLRVLSDDEARAKIEQEAARTAAEKHTTRARVRDLVGAIEGVLRERDACRPELEVLERPSESSPSEKRRWLFFVGDEPATAERKTYAERLASGLVRAGHEVVVTRVRRGVLPHPGRQVAGEPTVVELGLGPTPRPGSGPNRLLGSAAALHAGFARVAKERGAFDAFVGEGALGALVAAPLAERLGKPFVFALDACEVARRGNRLTREHLNIAELEHWAAERAAGVAVPSQAVADAVSGYYRTERAVVVKPPRATVLIPREAEVLAARLGLSGGFTLVLAPHEGEKEKAQLLRGSLERPFVLVTNDLRVRVPEGGTFRLAEAAPRGAVLASLLATAQRIVTVDPNDPRALEARDLGYPVATVDAAEALARGAESLAAATPTAGASTERDADLSALTGLVTNEEPGRAAEKGAPFALLQ